MRIVNLQLRLGRGICVHRFSRFVNSRSQRIRIRISPDQELPLAMSLDHELSNPVSRDRSRGLAMGVSLWHARKL